MLASEARHSPAMQRVLRQFCEALLSEGWANQLLLDRSGRLSWTFGSLALRAKGRMGAFGRFRLNADSLEMQIGTRWQVATLEAILSTVPSEHAQPLQQDLEQTARLTALNARYLSGEDRRGLPLFALETALHEGHPYHPCFKARSGFSEADHLAYGPEFGERFRLVAVFFDRDLALEALPHTEFWSSELGEDEWHRITTALRDGGQDPAQFSLLPLHPWQWAAVQDHPLLQQWIAQGRCHALGPIGDSYRATQSVRTLMNAQDSKRAHVKTAMAMRNTSSLRTLIPETVEIAPVISNWVTQVIDSDPLFANRYPLRLLPEYAGLIVGRDTELAGHLAAIWRQSPMALGIEATEMVPFNALSVIESDGSPFIAPWVDHFGIEPWVKRLIEVAVLPVWHLMVAHGIGLEAHGQNLILHHKDGWPTEIIARDFHDGVEYVPDLLSRPDLCPDLGAINPVFDHAPPDTFHRLSSADGLRELVMDTLFVFNLADLSDLLQRHWGFAESRFWQIVRGCLDSYAEEHGLQARQAMFDPFKRQIHAESLITRKLDPTRDSYRHLVPNSLSLVEEH
ncbi:Aerobactin synthase [Tritonibacter multivorans]|uniref:Aerobactin synthase n=1 Tax=Tritonibacter multivorans TaxID=928856 RepID=A0A0P1FZK6_9RHOB|nr:IucA/IucC family protein [Tritonibacter multivorans]MDA7422484.1 siderophore biosynthesis protein [Tritonibacter multivorans]CUH74854.1 Aerobactin synthase [Tritonibacter multivorans]SFD42621.1 Siderophore synthetase component [Tritonibacter multivorans]